MGIFETAATAQIIYHCRTDTGILKTGKAAARFTRNQTGRLTIDMDWEWLSGDVGTGQSRYEELDHEP